MKKIGLYLLVLLVGTFSVVSCEFDDTNIDPSRPIDADLRLILPQVITQTAYNQSANPLRTTGIIMQYFDGFDAQQIAYTAYVIGEDAFNNYWRFGLYAGALRSAQTIIDKTAEQDAPYYEGIAKIMTAVNYAQATTMFGDIPLTDALQGADNLKPTYDSQESVYQTVQTLLDEGISLMSGAGGGLEPGADDLVYGGDAAKWVAAAQAFKARYLAYTAKQNPDNWNKVLQIIDNSAFTSAADAPVFQFGTTQNDNSPLAKFGTERPNTIIIGASFANSLVERDDPRADFYTEQDEEGNFLYFGSPQLVWAQNNAAVPMISYTELMFLKAEAQYRTGVDKGDIQETLAMAIQSSLDLVGASDDNDYVSTQSNLDDVDGEGVLQQIIEEAYSAYFGYAHEHAWTNYRRTGYPALTPSADGASGLNPSGALPVRYLYPVSETQTNSASVEAAKSRQGGALLDDPLWAFMP